MNFTKTGIRTSLCALLVLALAASTAQAARRHARRHRGPQTEHAIATWYGPGFYGHRTACGQTLTPLTIGIASRTLACGTLVRVGYDGSTLVVPVIDRGPYSFATWDLTSGAAEALGISETVTIATRIVGRVHNTPQLGAPVVETTAASNGGVSAE